MVNFRLWRVECRQSENLMFGLIKKIVFVSNPTTGQITVQIGGTTFKTP